MFLDGFLSGFKWYRRQRGGSWNLVSHKHIQGQEWVRDRKPTEHEWLIDSEVYLEGSVISQISDGYHTFDELYQHRHYLFILWVNTNQWYLHPWKSLYHNNGGGYEGWFIAGATLPSGSISYHLPIKYWDLLEAQEMERAPEWDGHTSLDVLSRMAIALGEQKIDRKIKA